MPDDSRRQTRRKFRLYDLVNARALSAREKWDLSLSWIAGIGVAGALISGIATLMSLNPNNNIAFLPPATVFCLSWIGPALWWRQIGRRKFK